jgi:hypothetical protein
MTEAIANSTSHLEVLFKSLVLSRKLFILFTGHNLIHQSNIYISKWNSVRVNIPQTNENKIEDFQFFRFDEFNSSKSYLINVKTIQVNI